MVVEIQAIDPNPHQLLHQIGLYLEDLVLVRVEDRTTSMCSLVAKRKRTRYVVTGMIKVFNFDVDALLDQEESLSLVIPYVANKFDVIPQRLCETFLFLH